jgi:SAM-dependent methyltransferase
VGCGLKPYRSYFGKIDDYVGIDRSCTAEWTKALDVRASAESIPFKSNLFNIVLCTQVLEHVAFPEQTLKEMYRCLKSDGWLVLSTHGIWIEGHEAVDLWRWTSQGLQKVLSLAGFEIEEVYSMNSLISLFQFLLLYIPTSGVTKHVVFPCINMLARLLNGLLGKSSYFTGDRIGLHIVHFIIASKKKARAILVAASEKRSKRS